jgi:hypothetical protein
MDGSSQTQKKGGGSENTEISSGVLDGDPFSWISFLPIYSMWELPTVVSFFWILISLNRIKTGRHGGLNRFERLAENR